MQSAQFDYILYFYGQKSGGTALIRTFEKAFYLHSTFQSHGIFDANHWQKITAKNVSPYNDSFGIYPFFTNVRLGVVFVRKKGFSARQMANVKRRFNLMYRQISLVNELKQIIINTHNAVIVVRTQCCGDTKLQRT